ncbi:pyridoxamine 5'-phosphate oxidase family protein [Minwuia sp.]|uniref:pyridoxamine 5'-phosphate oxidase family protein n=1 Tax=Minwuia sp. TaxID=2493630 RepID=UPI003A8EF8C1
MDVFEDRPFFHEGMRALQDDMDGRRTADAIADRRVHREFWDAEKQMIAETPCFFIASTWDGYVDCSMKSGDPGFVRIVGPNTIEYPEYDGNSMYRTLGNIRQNPNIGLLFVKFDGRSLRMRINGKATILQDAESLARHVGAKFVVRVDCEIYPNCPRYVPDFAEGRPSPHVPRAGQGTPPPPEWKKRDYIRAGLPKDDPHRDMLDDDQD